MQTEAEATTGIPKKSQLPIQEIEIFASTPDEEVTL